MLAAMDQCLGFEGAGDFFMDEHGVLSFREALPHAPWAYMGAQIIDPRIVDDEPLEPFWLHAHLAPARRAKAACTARRSAATGCMSAIPRRARKLKHDWRRRRASA